MLIAELAQSSVLIHSCSSQHGHSSALAGVHFASPWLREPKGFGHFILHCAATIQLGSDRQALAKLVLLLVQHPLSPFCIVITVNNQRHHNFSEVALGYSLLSQ